MIHTLHVFDFDGTLVDSSHRYRVNPETGRIDLDYWIANEHRALDDAPLPLLDTYRELQATPGHYCMIATARIWCDLSRDFAKMHRIHGRVVARRDRGDTRKGTDLKVAGVRSLLNLRQFSRVEEIHVYEDNLDYLEGICYAFENAIPHFVPSNQGH